MKPVLAIIMSFAALPGCTSLGRLDAKTNPPAENESIFVVGVTPSNHRISAFPGVVENGVFHQNKLSPAALYGAAKDGFIVGKASAGDVLALTNVRLVSDDSALLLGRNFAPCETAKTFVFKIPEGKVIYIGSADYQFKDSRLEVRYRNDLQSAAKYIDENYPSLKGMVEYQEPQLLPTTTNCNPGPVYLPIYIKTR